MLPRLHTLWPQRGYRSYIDCLDPGSLGICGVPAMGKNELIVISVLFIVTFALNIQFHLRYVENNIPERTNIRR